MEEILFEQTIKIRMVKESEEKETRKASEINYLTLFILLIILKNKDQTKYKNKNSLWFDLLTVNLY
jgi:hypothetical protein